MTDERQGGDTASPYTAVVYFHGMGSQRRYEEVSRLIDSIDRYLAGAQRGMLMKIAPRLEPGRADPDSIFTYIRTYFRDRAATGWTDTRQVRFHEVYWAPVMAGQKSVLGVMRWMGRQIMRPWGTLRAPWRERQRLRRASLAALYEGALKTLPPGIELRDYAAIARRYDEFEGPDALRAFPEGHFKQFLTFLEGDRAVTAGRHQRLARLWRSHYRRRELWNGFALITIALALALLLGATVALAFVVLQRLTAFAEGTALASLAALAPPTWKSVIATLTALAGLIGLNRFLTDYMGDVEAWATYDETDEKHEKREKVIACGMASLEQVLLDDRCERVVIVAHSLGTTIAHDTLFALLRRNRAHDRQKPMEHPLPLTKIEHFVTLGSPIDKIEYFFESYRSPFHRYRRIVEYLRGDISSEPFTRNRKPFIHWINFWDDGDLISGPLHSPAGSAGFVQRVDNVHVANLAFPDPGASHSAYFLNRNVIAKLFEVIFERGWSFRALPARVKQDPDWPSAFLGPAIDPPGARRFWLMAAMLIPWSALAALILEAVAPALSPWPWLLPGAASAAVALGYAAGTRLGPRHPLTSASPQSTTGASEALMGGPRAADPHSARQTGEDPNPLPVRPE